MRQIKFKLSQLKRTPGRSSFVKTLPMLHFKPKLEYFDQRLKALKDALKGHEHNILTRDREVCQDWVSDGIAD